MATSLVFEGTGSGAAKPWILVSASSDAGKTWTTSRMPGGASAAPGHPLAADNAMTDPVPRFLSDGTAIVAGIAFNGAYPAPIEPTWTGIDLYVARSHDGGKTFPEIVVVAKGQGHSTGAAYSSNDRPFFDINSNGTIVLTWNLIEQPDPSSPTKYSVVWTTSQDGGKSWAKPTRIPSANDTRAGATIVGGDGTWYVPLLDFHGANTPAQFAGGTPISAAFPVDSSARSSIAVSHDSGGHWTITDLGRWNASFVVATAASGARPGEAAVLLPADGPDGGEIPAVSLTNDSGVTWSVPLALDASAPGDPLGYISADIAHDRFLVSYFHPITGGHSEFRIVPVQTGRVGLPLKLDELAEAAFTWTDLTGPPFAIPDGRAYEIWPTDSSGATNLVGTWLR